MAPRPASKGGPGRGWRYSAARSVGLGAAFQGALAIFQTAN